MSDDVFERWEHAFPDASSLAPFFPHPRERTVCEDRGTTSAWFGYESLCGWCYEKRMAPRPRLRLIEGGKAEAKR